ncbi:type II toxin-antitoxin system death-on-curing family toxin [Ferroacidibacillus organovorans]|uniref:type II toxin-antitoxin system death-on-curing family toxin n=1 Tax=Ferroacidibacillus organovorans TaxID=1765683 RepID=UPI0009EDF938|nr:type II toxin-antitoxin system death-on-curing family toxin [Ferroacidibacillus organovorans]
MIKYLTPEEVIAIHLYVIHEFSPGEQSGVAFPDMLDSAIHRPRHSAFGEDAYPGIFEKAAALFASLAQNHAFHNANKRTAFLSLLQFLSYNGYVFLMDQNMRLFAMTLDSKRSFLFMANHPLILGECRTSREHAQHYIKS